jgi:hypothetical protein
MLKGRALKSAIGLRERRAAFGRTVTQMPDHTPPDDGGQVDPLGETAAVLFVGQDIERQRQATPHQHRDQVVLPQGTEQAIEGHRGDMADGCRPFQAEAAVGGNQGLPGHLRAHTAIA